MVRLTMTPEIVRVLEQLQHRGELPQARDGLPLDEPTVGKPISHGHIIDVSRTLKQMKENSQTSGSEDLVSHHLDVLLRGSRVYIEPSKPKPEPVSLFESQS